MRSELPCAAMSLPTAETAAVHVHNPDLVKWQVACRLAYFPLSATVHSCLLSFIQYLVLPSHSGTSPIPILRDCHAPCGRLCGANGLASRSPAHLATGTINFLLRSPLSTYMARCHLSSGLRSLFRSCSSICRYSSSSCLSTSPPLGRDCCVIGLVSLVCHWSCVIGPALPRLARFRV